MGVLAGLLGCVFGVLGILSWGIIFVPLAALCAIVGLFRGIVGGSAAGIGTSLIAGVLTAIGFATSPSLWLLTAGLIGASLPARPPAPAHRAEPALSEAPPPPAAKSSDQSTDAHVFYENGQKARLDGRYVDAVKWYRKAADLGDAWAQTLLGTIYESGEGVPQDRGEAARWYRMAADQGEGFAREKLADLNTGSRNNAQESADRPLPGEKPSNTPPEPKSNTEISTGLADRSLSLKCTPDATSSSDSKDPIVTVVISLQGQEWRVTHIAASGARYERNAQYLVHGVQNSEAATWEGENKKQPHLKMVGQVFSAGSGKFTYVERLYDANSNGIQTYEGRSSCATSSLTSTDKQVKSAYNQSLPREQILKDKGAKCETLAVASRDGWARVRGQPALSGKPLWRITNGMIVTWCGEEWPDNFGHKWKWISYQSGEGNREGWLAAGLLAEAPNPTAKTLAAPAAQTPGSADSPSQTPAQAGDLYREMNPDAHGDYTYIAGALNGAFDRATHLPGNILIRTFQEASFQPHDKLNTVIRDYVEYLRTEPPGSDAAINTNWQRWPANIEKMTASVLNLSMQVKMDCHAGRVNGDDETSRLAKALEYMTASANGIRAKGGLEPLPAAVINDGCRQISPLSASRAESAPAKSQDQAYSVFLRADKDSLTNKVGRTITTHAAPVEENASIDAAIDSDGSLIDVMVNEVRAHGYTCLNVSGFIEGVRGWTDPRPQFSLWCGMYHYELYDNGRGFVVTSK
jgi:hypothetical protein